MDFESIKKTSDVVLEGVTVDIERQDASIVAITFTDDKGHVVRIAKTDYSGLRVLVPAKPKLVKRHAVVGTVKGLVVEELFEHEHQASTRCEELEAIDGAVIKLEAREVAESFDGTTNVPF